MSPERIRVLHVDDDPEFLDLARTFLERTDERLIVDTAPDGPEALDRLADEEYDCIVSDYDMPGRNGIELLTTIRGDFPRLPFILFTGKGSEAVASEAISAGVSDYLRKGSGPDRYELLANRIVNNVERTRARRKLEEREAHLRQAQAVANLGSWQLDVTADRLYWSEGVYRIFEAPDDEVLTYERFLEYVHPADRASVDETWQAALAGGEYDIEHRVVTGADETKWVHERADVTFDESGAPTKALGVVLDITDRKQRERSE